MDPPSVVSSPEVTPRAEGMQVTLCERVVTAAATEAGVFERTWIPAPSAKEMHAGHPANLAGLTVLTCTETAHRVARGQFQAKRTTVRDTEAVFLAQQSVVVPTPEFESLSATERVKQNILYIWQGVTPFQSSSWPIKRKSAFGVGDKGTAHQGEGVVLRRYSQLLDPTPATLFSPTKQNFEGMACSPGVDSHLSFMHHYHHHHPPPATTLLHLTFTSVPLFNNAPDVYVGVFAELDVHVGLGWVAPRWHTIPIVGSLSQHLDDADLVEFVEPQQKEAEQLLDSDEEEEEEEWDSDASEGE
ncbi:hypothetical protein FB451DRAFT_1373955 [Mycena latifolia]|nr:hypothetical protein FB451DRAFT_1373955 [Mycena latifolia]